MRLPRRTTVIAAAMLAGAVIAPAAAAADPSHEERSRHVLLLSVDGLHQADLSWYVAHHPRSALAGLVRRGVEFTQASTPVPSDSFPGLLAQVTGGTPRSTGVFYDSSFTSALLPAGTTSCPSGAPTGADVEYAENLDRDLNALDAGQGLPGLPGGILAMTAHPETLIDPAKLPVDPRTCEPVFPHQYLKVNTIFEVARQHDLRTAWSDKHPAYEILDGPSGAGVQDLFTPEINSQADGLPAGKDWTKDNAKTQQYDAYKAQAIRNEIDGFDHSRTTHGGVPAIFGMNFQSVSTAQKLPASGGQPGGYLADGVTPGPVLTGALDFVDAQVGSFLTEIRAKDLGDSTTIILSAKHGQSPTEPAALTRIPDGPLIDGLNTAWKTAHPGAGDLVAHATDDDAMLLWLADHSQAAAEFARTFLLAQAGQGNDITGAPKPFTASGLASVLAGREVTRYFGIPADDLRAPDVLGLVQHGVVYTSGTSKIAEHGGADPQDRHVPIILAGAGVDEPRTVREPVATTQIAPTILHLLGLHPSELKAVQLEHTQSLLGDD
ncbi:MAG TPA: alkaline phosphatase family protein [Pseudonocardiaceae bacterium]|nr:alkaline phosphatase family protein [Pseudonocardiaceae bacterium]